MAFFTRKPADQAKLRDLEALYKDVTSDKLRRDELLAAADRLIDLCSSFSAEEEWAYTKQLIKQSNRVKSVGAYIHPLYGYQFENRSIINEISKTASDKKASVLYAIEKEKELAAITEVLPLINNDYKLEKHSVSEIPDIKVQNITRSFDAGNSLRTFVVIDVETTGLYPGRDEIIQVAAIRYENFVPTESLVTYVNPGRHIPEDAAEVNKIYDDDVRDAPKLEAVAEDLISFIGRSPILGYNVSFDLSFLYCAGIDLITKRKLYDAKTLAKKLYKKNIEHYSLKNVLAYNGITISNLHDAKVDCFATGMIFLDMVREITG